MGDKRPYKTNLPKKKKREVKRFFIPPKKIEFFLTPLRFVSERDRKGTHYSDKTNFFWTFFKKVWGNCRRAAPEYGKSRYPA